jgi:hypothetical protein
VFRQLQGHSRRLTVSTTDVRLKRSLQPRSTSADRRARSVAILKKLPSDLGLISNVPCRLAQVVGSLASSAECGFVERHGVAADRLLARLLKRILNQSSGRSGGNRLLAVAA